MMVTDKNLTDAVDQRVHEDEGAITAELGLWVILALAFVGGIMAVVSPLAAEIGDAIQDAIGL